MIVEAHNYEYSLQPIFSKAYNYNDSLPIKTARHRLWLKT